MTMKTLLVLMLVSLREDVLTMKIHGGRDAPPHSRPYMVLLQRTLDNGTVQYCGGFLLSENFAVTAAHCKAKSYVAILGLHSYWELSGIQRIPVKATFCSEKYDGRIEDDVMLLQLSFKATLGKTVQPIRAKCQPKCSLPQSCSVAGWGSNNLSFDVLGMTVKLKEVNVTLVPEELCTDGNFYCSIAESGPRRGDSGGPLVCQGGLVYGVISKGVLLQSRLYGFTKISDHVTCIESAMKRVEGNTAPWCA